MTLKELRQQSGKTVKEVSDKLGIQMRTLYCYEQGTRQLGLQQVLILAELYDCAEREVIEAALKSVAVRSPD